MVVLCPPDHAYFEAPLRLHHAASGRPSPPSRLLATTTAHDAAPHWALPAVVTPTDAQPNASNYCAVVECIWKFIDLAKVRTYATLTEQMRARPRLVLEVTLPACDPLLPDCRLRRLGGWLAGAGPASSSRRGS